MTSPLQSLVATGTKLWLDSVDPDFVKLNRQYGATGATSNPVIISDLIKTGRFDHDLTELMERGLDDDAVAWQLADRLVNRAQDLFAEVFADTNGDDGYVSFELDPLLDDARCALSSAERSERYIELGKRWSARHTNRMIKVPGTPAGLAALEDLVAAGVTVNVTLLFTQRQNHAARDAVWRGAQRRATLDQFKSVYSIFVSRIDVYTRKHVPELSPAAQGLVGIVNAKRLWDDNRKFWMDKDLPLTQEVIFASTGTKAPDDPMDKYVRALAGSDVQTNPPETNAAIQQTDGMSFSRLVDQMPSADILSEIDGKVDFDEMEKALMREGLQKFADPQKTMLALIAEKRAALMMTP
ncbi:MAG: transaldolase [Planctomycetaceae bacterium]|nr:transaldolase [Planctomycetaceae bacterium]